VPSKVENDIKVEMEVHAAVSEKTGNYSPRSVPTLCQIMDEHMGKLPVKPEAITMEISALEKDAHNLKVKRLLYDMQAFRIWKKKCRDSESVWI
jgi:hypothetical protein